MEKTKKYFKEIGVEGQEDIDVTPSKTIWQKIGKSGYTFVKAMAEFIDNSIDERYEDKTLNIDISVDQEQIVVSDDARGMSKEKAYKALVLGESTKQDKLGEFGIGMKSAASSIGKTFVIMTTAKGSTEEYIFYHNEEEWESDSEWTKKLGKRKCEKNKHGTTITITELKKPIRPYLIKEFREDISRRYKPFLKKGAVNISVNEQSCKHQKEDLIYGPIEFKIKLKSGNIIHGWYGLLREGSNTGFYGFETFKKGKMVTIYDKIGFNPHPEVRQIYGEIHMDHVPWSFNKLDFDKESDEFREVSEAMANELKDLLKKARSKDREKTVTKAVEDEKNLWMEKIDEVVKLPELKDLTKSNLIETKEQQLRGDKVTDNIKTEVEQRDAQKNPAPPPEGDRDTGRKREPKKTHLKKRHQIVIKGKRFEYSHFYTHLNTDKIWKDYNVDKKKGIEIFTNIDFPAFAATKDKVFYAVIHIAESLAEILITENNESFERIDEIKQLILRKASQLVAQIQED